MTTTGQTDAAPKRIYHHGNLRAALIAAAVALVEEAGVEGVTIREAARRAGVSSGAPFRHFTTKQDLILAVAEDGMNKLRRNIEANLASCASGNPLRQILALSDGYLDWAIANPTHYRVLGDRVLIDFYQSETLLADNRWIRDQMLTMFNLAKSQGLLRPIDIAMINLHTRALAYGLARMCVDGHFREFGVQEGATRTAMREAVRAYLLLIVVDEPAVRALIDEWQ